MVCVMGQVPVLSETVLMLDNAHFTLDLVGTYLAMQIHVDMFQLHLTFHVVVACVTEQEPVSRATVCHVLTAQGMANILVWRSHVNLIFV